MPAIELPSTPRLNFLRSAPPRFPPTAPEIRCTTRAGRPMVARVVSWMARLARRGCGEERRPAPVLPARAGAQTRPSSNGTPTREPASWSRVRSGRTMKPFACATDDRIPEPGSPAGRRAASPSLVRTRLPRWNPVRPALNAGTGSMPLHRRIIVIAVAHDVRCGVPRARSNPRHDVASISSTACSSCS